MKKKRNDVEAASPCPKHLESKDGHCWCQHYAERDLRCCRCGAWTEAPYAHTTIPSFTS